MTIELIRVAKIDGHVLHIAAITPDVSTHQRQAPPCTEFMPSAGAFPVGWTGLSNRRHYGCEIVLRSTVGVPGCPADRFGSGRRNAFSGIAPETVGLHNSRVAIPRR